MNGGVIILATDATRQALAGIAPRVLSLPATDDERAKLGAYLAWATPSRVVIAVDEGTSARDDAVTLRQSILKYVNTCVLIPAQDLRDAATRGRHAVLGAILPLCDVGAE